MTAYVTVVEGLYDYKQKDTRIVVMVSFYLLD